MEEMIIDTQELTPEVPVAVEKQPEEKVRKTRAKRETKEESSEELISCLRNERVIVKFIPKEKTGLTKDHPFYGQLAEGATITYTVPMLRSGLLKDPLTASEKAFLEDYLGFDIGGLSVYNKTNNYWENFQVRLSKNDTILDLADANDYIKYKVLLLNKDFIADSLETLRNTPLETYRFVIVSDNEVFSKTADKMKVKSQCWEEYLKVKNDFDILRCIVETIDGRHIDEKTKIEFLQDKIDKMISEDCQRFLGVITDPLLRVKVLIAKAVDARIIEKRGEWYSYNDTPLCEKGENPTFTMAAKYLASARRQELKFSIEAKLKQ